MRLARVNALLSRVRNWLHSNVLPQRGSGLAGSLKLFLQWLLIQL